MAADTEPEETTSPRWFSRGVSGIGISSFLADLGHEIPTALLPSLLTVTLHAPASALGLIEGISDAAAGVARLVLGHDQVLSGGNPMHSRQGLQRQGAAPRTIGMRVAGTLVLAAAMPRQSDPSKRACQPRLREHEDRYQTKGPAWPRCTGA